MRYSKLRNVIKRIFGIVKNRFKILTKPRVFKIEVQVRVISTLYVLYNILINMQEVDEAKIKDLDIKEARDREDLAEN